MPEAWIVSTARSPIGRALKGALINVRPDDLAATIVKAALAKVPALDPQEVEDIIIGCAQPAGEQGYNLGRVVGLFAGLKDIPGTTVNRYCASSLQAIRMAAHAIKAGEGDVFVAGGVECVSRFAKGRADGMPDTKNPRVAAAEARTAARAAGGQGPWTPFDGDVPDVYTQMGYTAENVAEKANVSRAAMDEFAVTSQSRAISAQKAGVFTKEITPITLPDGTVFAQDECPRASTIEKLAELKPVFRPDGRVTAGNSCPLNDGAAAVVVMSDVRARALGVKPLARIVSSAVSGIDPEIMGLGPIEASKKALARAHLSINDIDLVEINEAFAAQVLPSAQQLGVPLDKLNVLGGAIALGHPFGMTGARIMGTLINALDRTGGRLGLETMCVGGGQGMAMIVERLQ